MKMKTIKIFAAMFMVFCAVVFCAAEADYKSGSYRNIQRPIMLNATHDSDRLVNPSHYMSEGVVIDQSKVTHTGSGVSLQSGAVTYYANLGYIPISSRLWNASNDKCIDYAYRGKIILFGEEYYVREIDASGFISACKGLVLGNVSNKSFSATAYGYGFKTEEMLEKCTEADGGYCWVAGANFTVRKPNGSTVVIDAMDTADAPVDNLSISLISVGYTADMSSINASILVYNTTNKIDLDNGYPLQINDGVKNGWMVGISTKKQPFDAAMNITEYKGIKYDQYLYANVTVTYTTSAILNMSTYLALPAAYKVVSNGTSLEAVDLDSTSTTTTSTTTTSSTTTTLAECTPTGNEPPCNEVSLTEVISIINAWTTGTANLNDVIALINAWAAAG
jgi:hypothetical protein